MFQVVSWRLSDLFSSVLILDCKSFYFLTSYLVHTSGGGLVVVHQTMVLAGPLPFVPCGNFAAPFLMLCNANAALPVGEGYSDLLAILAGH